MESTIRRDRYGGWVGCSSRRGFRPAV